MKGCKTLTLALLATAALGFGEVNSYPMPVGPGVGPQNASYSTPPTPNNRPDLIAPGTINYVEGQVAVDNRPLTSGGSVVLQPSQLLTTGNGFAEILLTPGSFLRVGHNSRVRIVSAGLADAKAQLDAGTALVEVDQIVKGTRLSVLVSGSTAEIEKKGLYEFDADQPAIRVLDGKLNVLEPAGSKTLGKDDQLLLAGEKPLKRSDFDMKALKGQPLYVWSEVRSQTESQANVNMAQNVRAYGGWYGPGWYWNPTLSFYSYLPGDGFLYSPFGFGFYSPAFIGYYGGFGYRGYYGYRGAYRGAYVGGVGASARVSGFAGGGFHGGGGHR